MDRSFFLQDTITVARACISKILFHNTPEGVLAGRIVETEAYLRDDPACHACRGMTKRNAAMFGDPGHAYIYFTYGFHYCLNFVTQPLGIGEAVLIRALEPLEGIERMKRNRHKSDVHDLLNGPGKLTQAMRIDKSINGGDLLADRLYLTDDGEDVSEIVARPRIGIRQATDELWRFYPTSQIEWVSKP